jgi:hypothetical protein
MRSAAAAIRALVFVVLALGGVGTGAAAAGDLDPIGSVTSVISTIASQTTVVSDLTGSVTSATDSGSVSSGSVSGAAGALVGSADSVLGSGSSSGSGTADATSSGGSGSGSRDGSSGSARASNPRSPHTRFDRLPRRYETLLERIESGRHVRANIARLKALLATASPELRARIMRLIRLELRRLERGGLTRRERAAARRLRGLLASLQPPASGPARAPLPSTSAEGSGVLAGTAEARDVPAGAGPDARLARRSESGPGGVGGGIPGLTLPLPPPSGLPFWPLLVLAGLGCLLLLLSGSPRHLLPSPVRGLVEVHQSEIWAFAGTIALGLLAGLLVVLIQAALL